MSFARYTSNEIIVVAANFNNTSIDCFLNLKVLKYIFNNFDNSSITFQKEDLLNLNSPK